MAKSWGGKKRNRKSPANVPAADGVIQIFTDGACEPNPGAGGWGYCIPEMRIERSGGARRTTNNQMEMMAAVVALEELAILGRPVIIWTDSRYLQNGITSWIVGWMKRGWMTSAGTPVLNKDLWLRLKAAVDRCEGHGGAVHFNWVKGHSGHRHNERADRLAAQGRADALGIPTPVPTDRPYFGRVIQRENIPQG